MLFHRLVTVSNYLHICTRFFRYLRRCV